MNIWALTKDEALKVLLLLWRDRAPLGAWVLMDTAGVDFKSLWMGSAAEPGLRAYVSTHGQGPGRYSVHLEYPPHEGSSLPGNSSIHEDLDADSALDLLHEHLSQVEGAQPESWCLGSTAPFRQ